MLWNDPNMTDSESYRKTRKKSGLGRGLSSLIPDIEAADKALTQPQTPETLPIDALRPNPFQPRTHFDPKSLEERTASLREEGILQPILVRETSAGYEIIAGERRVRAARMAGLATVPVIFRDLDDRRMLQISIVENIQRSALGPMEEARAYQRLVSEFAMTQEAVALCVGKSRSSITNFIRLLQLPREVQTALEEERLSMGHGRALLALEDEILLLTVFREVLEKGLSVRECEALIRKKLNPERPSSSPSFPLPEEYRKTAQRLSRSWGTSIRIRGDRNAGKLEIPYTSAEAFENLIRKLESLGS